MDVFVSKIHIVVNRYIFSFYLEKNIIMLAMH